MHTLPGLCHKWNLMQGREGAAISIIKQAKHGTVCISEVHY